MHRRETWIFAVTIFCVGIGVAAVSLPGIIWKGSIEPNVARIRARATIESPPFSPQDLAKLPAPVRRYFAFALTPGQAIVRTARIRQTGEFALRAGAWKPFTAIEDLSTEPPAFLWDARITMAGPISFFVRDSYLEREGALYAAIGALVSVADVRGTQAIAAGELLRYLAEAVFYPTALLPRDGISWTAIDDGSARVTLVDGATTVSCMMTFGERGEIVGMRAMRRRDAKDTEAIPWIGRFRDYRSIAGMMVPAYSEIEWHLPDGPSPYFRGHNVETSYTFAEASHVRDRVDR